MNDDMFEKLGAYYDGELSAHDQEQMQRLVESNPEYQQALRQFKMVSEGLSSLPKYRVPEGLNLTDKILAAADSQKNAGSTHNSSRNWNLDSVLFPAADEESEPISDNMVRASRAELDFPIDVSWRARISRALLWPTLVLGLALGFWFCNNQPTSVPVVLINNSPSEEEPVSLAATGDATAIQNVSFERSGKNSAVGSSAEAASGSNMNPKLVDAEQLRKALEPKIVSINENSINENSTDKANVAANDTADLFENPVPFVGSTPSEPELAQGKADESKQLGSAQPDETDLAIVGEPKTGQQPSNEGARDTSCDGTEPLRAINVSSSGADSFVNESNLKFTQDEQTNASKPYRLTFQCRYRQKNFDSLAWQNLLAEFGVVSGSADSTETNGGKSNPKTAVPTSWLWNSAPSQRAQFMQKAKEIPGIESVDSSLITIEPGSSTVSKDQSGASEIRLIPVE